MLRIFFALCFLAFSSASAFSEPVLPALQTQDLNGRDVSLPAGLPGEKTVVFIAFWRDQQPAVNEWVGAMGLTLDTSGQAWVELPVVGMGARLFKNMIDNGMRSGIVSPDMRGRTMTIYSSKGKFNRSMEITDTDVVYAAVVDRSGRVLAMESGDVTPTKIANLKSAL